MDIELFFASHLDFRALRESIQSGAVDCLLSGEATPAG